MKHDEDGSADLVEGVEAMFGGSDDEEEEEEEAREACGQGGRRADGGKEAEEEEVEEGYRSPFDPEFALTLALPRTRHSLWGHKLWPSAVVLAEAIEAGARIEEEAEEHDDATPPSSPSCPQAPPLRIDVRGKRVLELGAGAAALPSIVAALRGGARVVVATDYGVRGGDEALVKGIAKNLTRHGLTESGSATPRCSAVPFVWGRDTTEVLAANDGALFDVILMADLLFNRSEHDRLLQSCRECLAPGGECWVAFAHHDPHKAPLDMRFFEKTEAHALEATHCIDVQKVDVFQENDGLDDMRGLVHVHRLVHHV